MEKKVFRDNYTDKLSSPEQLDAYIKTVNPKMWILLIAMIIVLVNMMIWTYAENRTFNLHAACVASGGEVAVYIKEGDKADLDLLDGAIEYYNKQRDETYTEFVSVEEYPVEITEDIDHYLLHLNHMYVGEWAYKVRFRADIPDGVYDGYLKNS